MLLVCVPPIVQWKRYRVSKALSLNGMSALFYQNYLEAIGLDFMNYYLDASNGKPILSDLNQTKIVHVPKVSEEYDSILTYYFVWCFV